MCLLLLINSLNLHGYISHKHEAFVNIMIFCRKVQRKKGYFITYIHNNHEGEVENKAFED